VFSVCIEFFTLVKIFIQFIDGYFFAVYSNRTGISTFKVMHHILPMNCIDGEDQSGLWEDVAESCHRAATCLRTSVHRSSYCGCQCQPMGREFRHKSRDTGHGRCIVICETAKPLSCAWKNWQNWSFLCKSAFCFKLLLKIRAVELTR